MTSLNAIPGAPAGAGGMGEQLALDWGWLLFRGIFAVLFGLAAILMPAVALSSLALVFGVYLLVDGIAAVQCGVKAAQAHGRWGWLIVEGALGIFAGIGIALLPGAAIIGLITLAAVWGLVSGGALVAGAFRMESRHGRWLMVLSGLVSILWGALLLVSPISGAIVFALWLGAYALIFGAFMIFLAFHLRGLRAAGVPARAAQM
ncbi:HdeD family acid-resistance protein [Sphingomonas sp. PR090111-T3T-6A]|uniref:HdeD family acid-resistance protein n=1 Tax=Sphingomonas sp. PR090111-T3T-6A TaxID=685778 RepID=UPI0003695187|nr:DUF308 domain-containing protein [Sphingomonas sp. PR090111-T3T-6A]